eukprot:359504-Chlamydomonas_euryale.AAC.4
MKDSRNACVTKCGRIRLKCPRSEMSLTPTWSTQLSVRVVPGVAGSLNAPSTEMPLALSTELPVPKLQGAISTGSQIVLRVGRLQ